jgi:hypothetical protein
MTSVPFTRDVLLDVAVNFIPLLILGAFLVLFVVVTPWGIDLSLESIIQILLLIVPFGGLAIVTYVAAGKIET